MKLLSKITQLRHNDHLFDALCVYLEQLQPLCLAYSGGVDSTFLLAICRHVIDQDNFAAITITTPFIPKWELNEASNYAESLSVNHQVIEMALPKEIADNPIDRCYICKHKLFKKVFEKAAQLSIGTVIDGSNYDDLDDVRPGMKALVELGVISPLLDRKITKSMIRTWSKVLDLPTWDKPAYACLLTRLPHYQMIKEEDLIMIEAAETYLFSLDIKSVRVRKHGEIARIEVNDDTFNLVTAQRKIIAEQLKLIGFRYVTLDLAGYRPSGVEQKENELPND